MKKQFCLIFVLPPARPHDPPQSDWRLAFTFAPSLSIIQQTTWRLSTRVPDKRAAWQKGSDKKLVEIGAKPVLKSNALATYSHNPSSPIMAQHRSLGLSEITLTSKTME